MHLVVVAGRMTVTDVNNSSSKRVEQMYECFCDRATTGTIVEWWLDSSWAVLLPTTRMLP